MSGPAESTPTPSTSGDLPKAPPSKAKIGCLGCLGLVVLIFLIGIVAESAGWIKEDRTAYHQQCFQAGLAFGDGEGIVQYRMGVAMGVPVDKAVAEAFARKKVLDAGPFKDDEGREQWLAGFIAGFKSGYESQALKLRGPR